MRKQLSSEGGFTFVEVLAVILILGVLIAVALPNYFGAEADAKRSVDMANVRAINSALAFYKYRNSGACPADEGEFLKLFLADVTYFPDGQPRDPRTNTPDPYAKTYRPAPICRVLMDYDGVNHDTGDGH
ncbi:MAG: prepilin-type N-terminal cleavage/methylation domain-containing protein [bacterium]|nr:prepilin-type N-terminal cleavage/methylation domain-containing protein [bacterium]